MRCNSSVGPACWTVPPPRMTQYADLGKTRPIWWVTRILVLPIPNSPVRASSKSCRPTCASTALYEVRGKALKLRIIGHYLKISSRIRIPALEYMARANDTRHRCPPDKLIPLAPMSVKSPSGSI